MYGRWLERQGRVVILDDGRAQRRADYTKALVMYRRILSEFAEGESRFRDEAKNAVERITSPTVSVQVSNVFLPDSEVEFALSWRNVKSIDLTLSSIDLTSDVNLGASPSWLRIDHPPPCARIRNWKKRPKTRAITSPGSDRIRIDPKLPAGAYLLQARAAATSERALVLITDASIVVRTDTSKMVVFACNALTGAPIANARLSCWERHGENGHDVAHSFDATTNADGLAEVGLGAGAVHEHLRSHRPGQRPAGICHGFEGRTVRRTRVSGASTPTPIGPPIAPRKPCSGNSRRGDSMGRRPRIPLAPRFITRSLIRAGRKSPTDRRS